MIKSTIKQVVSFFLAFLICLFSIRLFGYWLLNDTEGSTHILSFKGFMNDISFASRVIIILSILQLIINFLTKRAHTFLFLVFIPLIIVAEISLLKYFLASQMLLDEALFSYSLSEFKIITGGSSLKFGFIIGLIALLVFYFGLVHLFKKFKPKNEQLFNYSFVLIFLLCFLPSITFTKNEQQNQYANNKTAYLIWRTYFHFSQNQDDSNLAYYDIDVSKFRKIDPSFYGGKAINENYPFFHELPDSSGFSNYFKPTSDGKPPNIVFVICESLGTGFVGDYASKSGHLMTFLDSLAEQSLYWPNFMSICDRTYQVLPASLASVPMMKGGTMFQELEDPTHFSLINLLEKYYYSRFYCGTFLSFTNMEGFMHHQNTSYIVKDWEDQFLNKINGKNTAWGYHEEFLFKKSWLDYKKQQLATKKRLDVFLTVSTHPPFELHNKKKYLDEAEKLLQANQKKYNEKYDDAFTKLDALVTYYYLDRQLKEYFNQAKNNPDFENTIFIIYGDHGTGNLKLDELSNYKIPLIIYSPLLKQPEKFLGVSSQLDLAPTLLNYLRTNYLPELPQKTTFAGKELSFSKTYENKRSLMLGSNERNSEFIVHEGYFLRHQQLYKIGANFSVTEVDNPKKFELLMQQKEYLREMITYTVYQDKFGPEDYLNKYIKPSHQNISKVYSFKKGVVFTGSDGKPAEFVDLGDYVVLKADMKEILIEFAVDYKDKSSESPATAPKLIVSIEDNKGNVLSYRKGIYVGYTNYKKGEWNNISTKIIVNIEKDLEGFQSEEELKIVYYIYNPDLLTFSMKNSSILFNRSE